MVDQKIIRVRRAVQIISGFFRIRRSNNSKELGQSTVEFALTMILLLGFTVYYFQFAMVMAWGNFVHYATFMSARALLAAGEDDQEQLERAKQVIVMMLKKSEGASGTDRFPSIGKGIGGSDLKGFLGGDLPPF